MFYSHTFLARKGPLGTVWLAAHLQHKLKKPHYTAVDIASSVDRIMFPEVPIALRMSGHLLLGVVRIYSKKVDYLYQDCNVVLVGIRKAFASVEVNLPEDATHAPFHSVTLPETYELDALELDYEFYHDGDQDIHLRRREEITITDQIPCERDPYVAISFDQDIRMDISPVVGIQEMGTRPMEEDAPPSFLMDTGVGHSDPVPSNQAEESNERLHKDHFPQELPEIEIMRDAVQTSLLKNFSVPELASDSIEHYEPFDQTMNEKIFSPVTENMLASGGQSMENMLASGGQSMPFQLRPEAPTSVASEDAPANFDSRISLGHISPELAIQPTPIVQKPKARSRKRKFLYDESLVLPNKAIKKALEDRSDIVHKRKKCPCVALDVWKFNNRSRKENILFEPSISGLCTNLQDIFKKDFISSKHHLILVEESHSEPRNVQSPAPVSDLDMEIERLRHEDHAGSSNLTEFMPPSSRFMPSTSRRDDFTPFSNNFGSESQMGTTVGTELPTPDITASSIRFGSELDTPLTPLQEQLGVEDFGLPDIPEFLNSAEGDDLNFLEASSSTPTGHTGMEEVDSLSVRTRAVAQYLQRKSPLTQVSQDQVGNLSLHKILEGKTRKLCARMFYETLVLKSYGHIDVQQEEAYGDINLKLTPTLTKSQF